jgi:hypothetical protein
MTHGVSYFVLVHADAEVLQPCLLYGIGAFTKNLTSRMKKQISKCHHHPHIIVIRKASYINLGLSKRTQFADLPKSNRAAVLVLSSVL